MKAKKLGILFLMLALISTAFLVCPFKGSESEAKEPITLIFSYHEAENNDMYRLILKPWFQRIEEESGGKVKIERHFNSELAQVFDAYDAVFKGVVDMAFIMQSMLPNFKLDTIIEAAYLDDVCYRPSLVYNELYNKYPEMQKPYSSVKTMLLFCSMPCFLGTTKVPVDSIDDIAGLKLCVSSAYQGAKAKALGATGVSVIPPELYTSLEKGIIDGGMVISLPQMITNAWADVVKNVTLITCIHPANGVIMNMKTWNRLPTDVQKLIDKMNGEIVELADQSMLQIHQEAKETLISEYGTNIITPDNEFFAAIEKKWKPVQENYFDSLEKEGVPAHAFYKDYMDLSQKYSAEEYNLNK